MNKFRLNAGIWTFIYVCMLVLTIALLFLIGLPFSRPGHLWISLGALVLAETAVYSTALFGIATQKRGGSISIGLSAFVTVSTLYLIAVAVIVILFSLLFDISVLSYSLIHLIVIAIAGIAVGMASFAFHKSVQDDNATSQTQFVQSMLHVLRDSVRQLQGKEEGKQLFRELEQLEEKVRFSDPVSHTTMLEVEHHLLGEMEKLAADIREYMKQPIQEEIDSFDRRIRDLSIILTDRNEKLLQRK
ncbi:hypothetical protein NV379_09760 [Paenibacillus sp. N1-5-1-14]|uniref:hypothetical protein n=1 Tax=Paenibacillus radicibacter TaxID=2972488 RepID=UPI0021590EE9|nr:hypothetical protein [Paenibacillus radicibacter]MCR8642945.1 hypothetical protein [Paenibacillus radicibacter]